MGCFQVRYDSRVLIYERKLFIRLATGCVNGAILWTKYPVAIGHHFIMAHSDEVRLTHEASVEGCSAEIRKFSNLTVMQPSATSTCVKCTSSDCRIETAQKIELSCIGYLGTKIDFLPRSIIGLFEWLETPHLSKGDIKTILQSQKIVLFDAMCAQVCPSWFVWMSVTSFTLHWLAKKLFLTPVRKTFNTSISCLHHALSLSTPHNLCLSLTQTYNLCRSFIFLSLSLTFTISCPSSQSLSLSCPHTLSLSLFST